MAERVEGFPRDSAGILREVELAEGPVAEVFACVDCGKMRSPDAERCLGCAHERSRQRRERARLLVKQGYSNEEVAAHLGLAVSTVKEAARGR